jgi:glycosylphosphatidylinositol phospholipase D
VTDLDPSRGFMIFGAADLEFAGIGASALGDADGDGIDDLLIGANGATYAGAVNAGRAYLLFGSPSLGAGGVIDLARVDPSSGVVIAGTQPGEAIGTTVGLVPDVNGDGLAELLLRAPTQGGGSGGAFLVYGDPAIGTGGTLVTSAIDGLNGALFRGIGPFARTGSSISTAGDWNGDGLSDFLVGAPQGDVDGDGFSGETYLVQGLRRTLRADHRFVSIKNPTPQLFTLDAGADNAGRPFMILGSMSGYFPGITVPRGTIPLNFDDYTLVTILDPDFMLVGGSGVLDAQGQASASFVIPPGCWGAFVGVTLRHAYFVCNPNGSFRMFSNQVPLTLDP